MLTRQRQTVAAVLGERISVYDSENGDLLGQLKAGFMARGADAVTATERATGVARHPASASLDGVVRVAVPIAGAGSS